MAKEYEERIGFNVLKTQYGREEIRGCPQVLGEESRGPVIGYLPVVKIDVESTNPKYSNLKRVVFYGGTSIKSGDRICATIDKRTLDETMDGFSVQSSKLELISKDGQIRDTFE